MDAILNLDDLTNTNLDEEILLEIVPHNYKRLKNWIHFPDSFSDKYFKQDWMVEIPFKEVPVYGLMLKSGTVVFRKNKPYYIEKNTYEYLVKILSLLREWSIKYDLELPPNYDPEMSKERLNRLLYKYVSSQQGLILFYSADKPTPNTMMKFRLRKNN